MPYRFSYYNIQLSSCKNISIESMFNRGGNRDCGSGFGSRGSGSHQPMFQKEFPFHRIGTHFNCYRQLSSNVYPWTYQTPFNVFINRLAASATSSLIPLRTMVTRPWMMTNDRLTNDSSNVKRIRYDVPIFSGHGTSGHRYFTDSRNHFNPNHRRETQGNRQLPTPHKSLAIKEPNGNRSVSNMKKVVDSIRQWTYTERGKSQKRNPQPGFEFSIVSYNVLAQSLLEDNSFLYVNCNPEILDWNHRKETLMNEFRQTDADILCLQEVQNDHYEDFFKPNLLELGYSSRYKKRTGNKNDGCAIFYKKRVFKLEKWASVEYCKAQIRVLDRDNIALILMLRPRCGTVPVCVVNTHLLYNPNRGDIKLAQMRILMAEVDRFAFRNFSSSNGDVYHPVIMCGDMNSQPYSPLYTFVTRGTLYYDGLVARDVSGQVKDSNGGQSRIGKELVPSSLGISDRCQYVRTVRERSEIMKDDKPDSSESKAMNETESDEKFPFCTGQMSHELNLVSSYTHQLSRLAGESEVTTHHHQNSCTVDYIFYSVQQKESIIHKRKVVHKRVLEGPLQLLATCELLSRQEMDRLGGLPNAVQPSDHLPLAAKFLLLKGEH